MGQGSHKEWTAAGPRTKEEAGLHINVLEMRAVPLALTIFQECLMGHTITLISSNTIVVVYLNKQGGSMFLSFC